MQDAPSVLPALLAFLAVAALIPVALWVLKRLQGGTKGGARPVTLAGGLTLGPRERVVIVEADGRRWLLGVTGHSISMLAELERTAPGQGDADTTAPGQSAAAFPPNPFAQILDRLKRNE
jgi:flagellar protein FliO/FliZ